MRADRTTATTNARRRRIAPAAALLLIAAALAVPAASQDGELTLDQVVERHIEAIGGADAWHAVESISLAGTYFAFSEPSPFTIHLRRGGDYRFELALLEQPVVMAMDQREPWWINPLMGLPWAVRPNPNDAFAIMLDGELESPLLDWQVKGHTLELAGREELDGMPVIRLELKRAAAGGESRFLHPESYLEVARISPYADFGQPQTMTSFFDDYREVGGVMVPHFVEQEFGIRFRRFEVAEATVRGEGDEGALDDALFRFPLPAGMERLATLAGSWEVTMEVPGPAPQAPWRESTAQSVIRARTDGALLEEETTQATGFGPVPVVRLWSYDRFQQRYRIAQMLELYQHLDILESAAPPEGDGEEAGPDEGDDAAASDSDAIVFTNQETGTAAVLGAPVLLRGTLHELTADSFRLDWERSQNGGESWTPTARATYRRVKASDE